MAFSKAPPPPPPPSLSERITALRADIESHIDGLVEKLKLETPGIPGPVLRGLLTNRSGGCLCRAYLQNAETQK